MTPCSLFLFNLIPESSLESFHCIIVFCLHLVDGGSQFNQQCLVVFLVFEVINLNCFDMFVQILELTLFEEELFVLQSVLESQFDELDVFFDAFAVKGGLDLFLGGVVGRRQGCGRVEGGSL